MVRPTAAPLPAQPAQHAQAGAKIARSASRNDEVFATPGELVSGQASRYPIHVGGRVLVIDDDQDMCELVADGLGEQQFTVDTATTGQDALDVLRSAEIDAVVVDVQLEYESGIDLCKLIVENHPSLPVIIMTAHGDLDVAIAAMRAGAYDFVAKPFKMEALAIAVRRAMHHRELTAEVRRLRQQVERAPRIEKLIGASRSMRSVFDLVAQVAEGDASVLITGESGTGKELVARAIHEGSPRSQGSFVAIDCAAMPATLLESELFGHVKGAFTDAKRTRVGLFQQASGGTLFLDEIGEMPAEMQAKLLRVLQERRMRPVGGDEEVSFDTRVITATNRDLETEVADGRFREDLYYRINVVRIHVPALRARGNDVLLLAQHFLDQQRRRTTKNVHGISPAAARLLLAYDWPGNVRELENCIERAVTLTRFEEITPDALPDRVREHQSSRIVISGEDPAEMPSLEEMERRYIRRVLESVRGNKTHAARVLHVDRRTLYRKLERLDIADTD